MKAIKYQIGNLVECNLLGNRYTDRIPYYGKNIYSVFSACKDFVKLDLSHDALQKVEIQEVNPIFLTDEWMAKTEAKLFPWGWVIGEVLIRTNMKDKFWIELGNGVRIDLTYVHTLQNFIALIGEELTFNA